MARKWTQGWHLLFWIHSGGGQVTLDTGAAIRLHQGEGIWVPANINRAVSTDEASVGIPILIRPDRWADAPTRPVVFTVPHLWAEEVVQHYVHSFSPITRSGYREPEVGNVISAGTGSTAASAVDLAPVLPRSAAASAVAQELARRPDLNHRVTDWAALASCSPSTLQRAFLVETGLTFGQWRSATRLATAAHLLAGGMSIAMVAAQTGFASRRGFTASFRQAYGVSPSRYAAAVRPADLVPESATHTLPRINGFHVLIWLYRGTGQVWVDGQAMKMSQGDAVWLPAGRQSQTQFAPGSVAVPLGDMSPCDAPITEPVATRFPDSWERYLLWCSVTSYRMLRPVGYNPGVVLELFDQQRAVQRARSFPLPANPAARVVATQLIAQGEWSVQHLPAYERAILARALRAEHDSSVAQWMQAVRMSKASEFLSAGVKIDSVAARIGYRHTSNFSRAFSRCYGISPREYQRHARHGRR